MNRVDTKCKVRVYEIDGEATKGIDAPSITVESHWNDDERIVLVFGNGKGQRFTVVADDLLSAIRRATGD